MRNVKQDLADMSQNTVNGMRMERLARMYTQKALERRAQDRANEDVYRADTSVVEQLKVVVAKALDKERPVDGKLPVNSNFDALQIVKSASAASEELKQDSGVKALTAHLEKKWQHDRTGEISMRDYRQLREKYSQNFPRSAANGLIEKIGTQGYVTLPLSDLMRMASQIRTQDDFEQVCRENGIHTNQPHHIKARSFIISVCQNRD